MFGLIAVFASVAMYATKYIIPETESFLTKLIHHRDRDKFHPENLPNFTNHLDSIIEEGNDTSPSKRPPVNLTGWNLCRQ